MSNKVSLLNQKVEIINAAGFWPRLLAHNIDLLPILGCFYLSTLMPVQGYDILVLGSIYVGYHTLFEISPWNATPGKKWVGIRVVDTNHGDANPGKILLRNVGKGLSLILFFGGFIMIFFSPKRQGLHDYIGGTLVLFNED